MKTRTPVLLACCCLLSITMHAQLVPANTTATEIATVSATRFVEAFRHQNWNEYINLSYPGVVRYYGGKNGYLEFSQRARATYQQPSEGNPEKLRLLQMLKDNDEWQCVIEKTSETDMGIRRIKTVTYLVGQSADEGQTWQFVDVAFNSVENLNYVIPDIFDALVIPQRALVTESGVRYKQNEGIVKKE